MYIEDSFLELAKGPGKQPEARTPAMNRLMLLKRNIVYACNSGQRR